MEMLHTLARKCLKLSDGTNKKQFTELYQSDFIGYKNQNYPLSETKPHGKMLIQVQHDKKTSTFNVQHSGSF